jgi:hypothetical protein
MAIYTPWEIEEASSVGSPRIVDGYGNPVCSFGNESRWRGIPWAWEVARAIVKAVNAQAAKEQGLIQQGPIQQGPMQDSAKKE